MMSSKVMLIAFLLALGASVLYWQSQGKAQATAEDILFGQVQTMETAAFNGKYQQVPPTQAGSLVYEVYEYVSPEGPGWQLLIYESGKIKASYGYGPEAQTRTFVAPPPYVSVTSTP